MVSTSFHMLNNSILQPCFYLHIYFYIFTESQLDFRNKNMRYILVCCMLMIICLPYESFCKDPQFEKCKDRVCGNQTIRFPFYTDVNFRYCGYPGFGLTCLNNDVLLLNISQGLYRITEIFYTNNSFHVSNILSSRSGFCSLDKIQNLSLPSDGRFQLNTTANFNLLSNCTPQSAQIFSRYRVGCDQGKNDADWVLAIKTQDPYFNYATKACKTLVVAPIRDYIQDDPDYLKLIRNGFDLKWVATDCSECEASGGYCGYQGESVNKFKCFCDDRPHSRSCKSKHPLCSFFPPKFLLQFDFLVD